MLKRAILNPSPLSKMIYSLSSGNVYPKLLPSDSGLEPPDIAALKSGELDTALTSQISASALATDLVVRAADVNQVGDMIRSVSYHLEHAKNSQLKDIFSQIRLTQSRSHEIIEEVRAYVRKVLNRQPIGPRDLIIFSADNLQWLFGNEYDHWVTVLLRVITEEELIKLGILNDDVPEEERLSRKPIEWPSYVENIPKDERAESILGDVFRANDEDYSRLGEIFLSHFALVLKHLHKFPGVAECKKSKQNEDYISDEPIYPVLFRFSTESELKDYPGINEEPKLDDEKLQDDCPSMWKMNNIYAQPPFRLNMSNKATVLGLKGMVRRITENQLERFNASEDNAGKEPPIDRGGLLMDGAPLATLLKEMQKSEGGEFEDVMLPPALFHLYTEIFKKTHDLTVDIATFIAESFSGKDGDDNIDFFLNFSDPTKPERQMSQIILAVMAYVLRCMENEGQKDASAVDAYRYMIEMAIECPTAKALLDLVLLYQVVILTRRAARLNSRPMVLSVLRLSLPLFCATHATGYARIAADFLKFEATMSEMERVIQPLLMTLKTVNGEYLAGDQGQEWYNCLIKQDVGTPYTESSRYKVESSALNCLDREATGSKRALEKMRYGGYVQDNRIDYWTKDGETYIKVTLLLDRSGIMERDKKVKPSHARFRIDNDTYCSATNGKQLPADLMRWFSLGLEKMEKYVTDNYIENPTRASRSEEHIDSILLTSEQATKLKTKLVKLKTSVVSEVLGANGTTKELVQELNELLEHFPAIDRPQRRIHKSSRKPDVINELIRVRQAAFGIDESLEDRLREEAKNCVEIATSSQEREDELRNHSFYMFTDDTKNMEEFVKKRSLKDENWSKNRRVKKASQ